MARTGPYLTENQVWGKSGVTAVGALDPRADQTWMGDNFFTNFQCRKLLDPQSMINIPKKYAKYRTYIVPGGIGDIAWIYSKLHHLNEPLVFVIAGGARTQMESAVSLRAIPFVNLLPNVKYCSIAFCTPDQIYHYCEGANFTNCRIPASPSFLCFNQLLDNGTNLDNILPLLKTDRHFPIKKPAWANKEADVFLKKDEKAFAIYTSSANYYCDQNMSFQDWTKLVIKTAERKPDHKIILMGAPWDCDLMVRLYDFLCGVGFRDNLIMMHDRDISVVLEVLRRCQFMIGAVSGLTIVAEYQKVPTIHLYPKQLYTQYKLEGTWESPEMVRSNKSISIRMEEGSDVILSKTLASFEPFK
jgi:hypothetical protein